MWLLKPIELTAVFEGPSVKKLMVYADLSAFLCSKKCESNGIEDRKI